MELKPDPCWCRSFLRVVGLVIVWVSVLVLISNLVETWGTLSLAYWKSYIRSEIARPVIFAFGGGVLCLSAGWLSRRMVR